MVEGIGGGMHSYLARRGTQGHAHRELGGRILSGRLTRKAILTMSEATNSLSLGGTRG